MKFAVLGTGTVGRAIAGRLDELGHDVTIGTRDPQATLARTEPDGMGNLPYAEWAEQNVGIRLASFSEAAGRAEVVVNATSGGTSLEVLALAGPGQPGWQGTHRHRQPARLLSGHAAHPVGEGHRLSGRADPTRVPSARVVKTLNTLTAALMVRPDMLPEGSSVFVSGDDAEAKFMVSTLLKEFGHTDVIDLGDLSTARGTEMLLPIWLRLMGSLGTPMFNFKIVR